MNEYHDYEMIEAKLREGMYPIPATATDAVAT